MNPLDTITDSYEFGWNITRSVLAGKTTYGVKTAFGDYIIKKDTDLRRSMEAERLHHKYTKMLHRGEKTRYATGAIALIKEWDRIGVQPEELTIEDTDEGEGIENEEW
jgi:hypothetical protein